MIDCKQRRFLPYFAEVSIIFAHIIDSHQDILRRFLIAIPSSSERLSQFNYEFFLLQLSAILTSASELIVSGCNVEPELIFVE